MRVIPRKIKVKQVVYKCFSLKDILVFSAFAISAFIFFVSGNILMGVIFSLLGIILVIPVGDEMVYSSLLRLIKFMFSKKKYLKLGSRKYSTINITGIKSVENESGYGKINYENKISYVIAISQKNFSLQEESKQDIDIECFEKALSLVEEGSYIDIIKIERPLILDGVYEDLSNRLKGLKKNEKFREKLLFDDLQNIDSLNYFSGKLVPFYYIQIYGDKKDTLSLAEGITNELKKIGLNTHILGVDETVIFLKYKLGLNFNERDRVEMEDVIPKEISFSSSNFKIDGQKKCIYSISDYPLNVKNGYGSFLCKAKGNVSMRIYPLSRDKGVKLIDEAISELDTKATLSYKASELSDTDIHRESLSKLLLNLQAGGERLFNVKVFIYFDEENRKNVRRNISFGGFKASSMYIRGKEGFKEYMGFEGNEYNLRSINSLSTAAFFPFDYPRLIDEKGYYLGESDYPAILNIWKRGDNYQNSNGFVVGKSGSGKSFFLKNLILKEWSRGTKVVILDPEAEYLKIVEKAGGKIIDVASGKEGRINPFHIYSKLDGDSQGLFLSHLKVLESFFRVTLVGADNDTIELINNLVYKMYTKWGINEKTDVLKLKPKDFPTFDGLYEVLLNENLENKTEYELRLYSQAKIYIEKFTEGRFKDVWNGESNLNIKDNLMCFNFQKLFSEKNDIVSSGQMLLIFTLLEEEVLAFRKNGGEHFLIVCDEAHLFIDPKYPIALDFFFQMNKRIRKYGGSIIPATQNISDWSQTEELSRKTMAIIKNSQYSFIFKLSAPDMQDLINLYSTGERINKDESKEIVSLLTGETFFISGLDLRMKVKIKPSKFVKDLING